MCRLSNIMSCSTVMFDINDEKNILCYVIVPYFVFLMMKCIHFYRERLTKIQYIHLEYNFYKHLLINILIDLTRYCNLDFIIHFFTFI